MNNLYFNLELDTNNNKNLLDKIFNKKQLKVSKIKYIEKNNIIDCDILKQKLIIISNKTKLKIKINNRIKTIYSDEDQGFTIWYFIECIKYITKKYIKEGETFKFRGLNKEGDIYNIITM
jgi:hypothetical protein